MSDDCVKDYQLEWVQEQIWELERKVEELQMENTLLRNDIQTLKTEGCWRFVEDAKHHHKPQGAAELGSYKEDKARGLVD